MATLDDFYFKQELEKQRAKLDEAKRVVQNVRNDMCFLLTNSDLGQILRECRSVISVKQGMEFLSVVTNNGIEEIRRYQEEQEHDD